ncbi:MAG: [citrate (pro-3S)-lyase] ligase [Peptoniphilaceae bacterium]|nr:[citrate (pro-3S)-lyase] ligase [Peptoniphilaceae bacterium]MDY6018840.1 [citrate (pro-3S)-lyase] ligase [Anaerococcus sp.]
MEKIYPNLIKNDKKDLETFLLNNDLIYEDNIESTFVKRQNGQIIGTGSRHQNIIKCLAIDDNYKGSSLINEIITILINEIYNEGYDNIFLYTKPIYQETFARFGFNIIEEVKDKLIFMERSNNFSKYLEFLENQKVDYLNIGSIIMNANPFTLGHRYLVEYGAKNCDYLYIFLVSEDLSTFSTKERLYLVKEGCKDIKNLKILPTYKYLISSATFPSYFIKKKDELTEIQARLDCAIFKNHIGKALNINKRFVGDEKQDQVTDIYNKIMKEELTNKPNPIEIIEVPRLTVDGKPISASIVRSLISKNDFKNLEKYLPPTSFSYILKKYKDK